MEHHLKIQPVHFDAVSSGLKLAELRKNDRNFKAGDILHLHEWDGKYTDRHVSRVAMHVADVSDYLPDYVLISMCGNFKGEAA